MVERSLCMWKARGSIPRISTYFLWQFVNTAVVAEWLRRWTWNPMGSARVGSNPANCDNLFRSQKMPPMGIEPMTPGLRDQCSTTELKRLCLPGARFQISSNMQHFMSKIVCLSFDFLWQLIIAWWQFCIEMFCHGDNNCVPLPAQERLRGRKLLIL